MNEHLGPFRVLLSGMVLLAFVSCSGRKPPEPEFYGVYALNNGTLHLLQHEDYSEDGPALDPNVRLIVYLPNAMEIASDSDRLVLREKGKIRQDVELYEKTKGLRVMSVHQTPNPAVVFDETVPLQMKAGTKEGSLELVSAQPVRPGRYVLDIKGDFYPLHVVETPGQQLPVYDRYYETVDENRVYDILSHTSQRGMLDRTTIGDHFITKEYYKPAEALAEGWAGQRAQAIQAYEGREYAEAYLLAKSAMSYFKNDTELQEILDRAPIEAMDVREQRGEWKGLDRWVDSWVDLADHRADVVERGKQLRDRAAFGSLEALADEGDWRGFQKEVRRFRSSGVTVEQERKLGDLLARCRREMYLSSLREAETRKDVNAMWEHGEHAWMVAPEEGDREHARTIFEAVRTENPYGVRFLEQVRAWDIPGLGGAQPTLSFAADSSHFWIHKPHAQTLPLLRFDVEGGKQTFSYPNGFVPKMVNRATGIAHRWEQRVERPMFTLQVNGRDVSTRQVHSVEIARPGESRIRKVELDGVFREEMNASGEWLVLADDSEPRPGPQSFVIMKVPDGKPSRVQLPFTTPQNVNRWSKDHIINLLFSDREGDYVALGNAYGVAMYSVPSWTLLWSAKIEGIGSPIGISHKGQVLHYIRKGYVGGGDWVMYNHKTGETTPIDDTDGSRKRYSDSAKVGLVGSGREIQVLNLEQGKVMGEVLLSDLDAHLPRGDRLWEVDISPDGRWIAAVTQRGNVMLLKKTEQDFESYWERFARKREDNARVLGHWKGVAEDQGDEDAYLYLMADGYCEAWEDEAYWPGSWEMENGKLVIELENVGRMVNQSESEDSLVFVSDGDKVKFVRLP